MNNLVEWTNSNYAQQLQPDKNQMKWTDMYPDKIQAFLAVLIVMNDMCRFECHFGSEGSKWYLQIAGITTIFTRDRFKQLKRYSHFCDPNAPVPAMNNPAFDRLNNFRPVVSS